MKRVPYFCSRRLRSVADVCACTSCASLRCSLFDLLGHASNPEKSSDVLTFPGNNLLHLEHPLQEACPVKPQTFLAAGTSHPTQSNTARYISVGLMSHVQLHIYPHSKGHLIHQQVGGDMY